MWRRQRGGLRTVARNDQPAHVRRRAFAQADLDEHPNKGANHLVAKRVSTDVEAKVAAAQVVPMRVENAAAHRVFKPVDLGSLGFATKRREVVLADDRVAGQLH